MHMRLVRYFIIMSIYPSLLWSMARPPAAFAAWREAQPVTQVILHFAEPHIEEVENSFVRLSLGELPRLTEAGKPALPYRLLCLLLPAQGTVQWIQVTASEERWLSLSRPPEPARPQYPISRGLPFDLAVSLDARAYKTPSFWPSERYHILSEQWLHGNRLLLMRVFPLRYHAGRRLLSYTPSMQIQVFMDRAEIEQDIQSLPEEDVLKRLQELVDNPQDIGRYACAPRRPSHILIQRSGLVDPSRPCDYIIITNRALRDAFQPLVAWRREQGLNVDIFEIEEILANYDGLRPSGGSDDATKLRNFLIDAYSAWAGSLHPLRYVLLGGDTEIIPARPVYVRAGIYETDETHPLVSDAYYAGLDGDWDADRDGLYGEGAASLGGTGEAGEEADLYAELFVGRVPVNELSSSPVDQEARNWVAKVLRYEGDPQAPYLNRGLWLGERLDDRTYGDDSKELILEVAPDLNVERLYDGFRPWTANDLKAAIAGGVHIINHLGHASSSYVLRMSKTDVASLANVQPFWVHSQGCLAAAIASPQGEAIAETFLTAPHGAFAFIGNTSYGWYMPGSTNGASQMFDLGLFKALYEKRISNLCRALQWAKEECLNRVGAVGPERWVYLELILLGDPYTPIVTQYVSPIARVAPFSRLYPLAGEVQVRGSACAGKAQGARFSDYRLYYGSGTRPREWIAITPPMAQPVADGLLGSWDVSGLADGLYTLRLQVSDGRGLVSTDDQVILVDHAFISSPSKDSYLRAGDMILIQGTAYHADLLHYSIDVGFGTAPQEWRPIVSSTLGVVSGTLVAWDSRDLVQAGTYTLRLTVEAQEYRGEDRLTIVLDPLYVPGWPRTVANRLSNESLAVGDLDGDGEMEIVAAEGMRNCGGALNLIREASPLDGGRCGTYGMLLYVWNARGELLPGWPRMPGSDNRLTSPALADLNGDGSLEIIIGSIDGSVYVYRPDGGELAGWPQRTCGEIYGTPACADLDGDGSLEVVACNAKGQVHVWYSDGSRVAGWPQDARGFTDAPLLADLNGDGKAEVVVASASGRVSAWHGDGSPYPGWPVDAEGSFSAAPVAGDLDCDGNLEIVAVSDGTVYAWRTSGEPLVGWPIRNAPSSNGSSPALADLDGDGKLEVIITGRNGGVHVWRCTGQAFEGWGDVHAVQAPLSSPIVGDMDGDGFPEVIVVGSDNYGEVHVFNHDGSPMEGWPRRIPRRDTPYPCWDRRTSGTLIDLDGDGKLELGVGVESYVYFWRLEGGSHGVVPWPTFRGNFQRTGMLPSRLTFRQYWPLILTQANERR